MRRELREIDRLNVDSNSHKSLAAGDLDHSYNRIRRSGQSDYQVLRFFLLLSLLVGSSGLVMILTDQAWLAVFVLALCLGIGVIFTKQQHLF